MAVPDVVLDPDEVLERYAKGPDVLDAAVASGERIDIDASRGPGTWSIRQIVHHLADSESLWALCIKMAIAVPEAPFRLDWYPGNDPWAAALAYDRRPVEPALALIRSLRTDVANVLGQFPERWSQPLNIEAPQIRPMTLGDLVVLVADHVEHHVAQIDDIRNRRGR